ncbi:MAG: hypothetical protein K0R51_421 [Cytophagaceae bacterium]|jgi:hypothetical protein|nr:hypothetical protein [Cytophagaceae bacterium]
MKCPHCLVDFHDSLETISIGTDIDGYWDIQLRLCSSCKRNIYHLSNSKYESLTGLTRHKSTILIRPKIASRTPVPAIVPSEYSNDYTEACLVLADSPKASAALSRRCLQYIIRQKLNIQKRDLVQEIQEVIDKGLLPTDILDSIDAIRNIGNFAAHPTKSKSTGEIVEVEPHEAEWNLDVLEMLFEYLFVRPDAIQKKRDALNAKLNDAGKNDMK